MNITPATPSAVAGSPRTPLASMPESRRQMLDGIAELAQMRLDITGDPVHVHELQATILHLLGINHERHT